MNTQPPDGAWPVLNIVTQAELNAAILAAVRQTEDAIEPLLDYHRRMSDHYRREADDYYYRWRSET